MEKELIKIGFTREQWEMLEEAITGILLENDEMIRGLEYSTREKTKKWSVKILEQVNERIDELTVIVEKMNKIKNIIHEELENETKIK